MRFRRAARCVVADRLDVPVHPELPEKRALLVAGEQDSTLPAGRLASGVHNGVHRELRIYLLGLLEAAGRQAAEGILDYLDV